MIEASGHEGGSGRQGREEKAEGRGHRRLIIIAPLMSRSGGPARPGEGQVLLALPDPDGGGGGGAETGGEGDRGDRACSVSASSVAMGLSTATSRLRLRRRGAEGPSAPSWLTKKRRGGRRSRPARDQRFATRARRGGFGADSRGDGGTGIGDRQRRRPVAGGSRRRGGRADCVGIGGGGPQRLAARLRWARVRLNPPWGPSPAGGAGERA